MTDTPERIAQIRQRAENATTGPWEPYDNYVKIGEADMVQFDTSNPLQGDSSHDTHFIAHAREDIPYLLDLVAAHAATIAGMRQSLEKAEAQVSDLQQRLARGHD